MLRRSTVTVRLCCFVYFRIDTENSDKGYDDRQVPESDVTTETSDFYNVYYPVMEAQTVTDSHGKASRNTGYCTGAGVAQSV
jgi:hypothetical protein